LRLWLATPDGATTGCADSGCIDSGCIDSGFIDSGFIDSAVAWIPRALNPIAPKLIEVPRSVGCNQQH
jgi:hypothetical protein